MWTTNKACSSSLSDSRSAASQRSRSAACQAPEQILLLPHILFLLILSAENNSETWHRLQLRCVFFLFYYQETVKLSFPGNFPQLPARQCRPQGPGQLPSLSPLVMLFVLLGQNPACTSFPADECSCERLHSGVCEQHTHSLHLLSTQCQISGRTPN